MTSKHLGELVEARTLCSLLEKGFVVSKPFGDNSKYDFVIDTGNGFKRVQIKSSTVKRTSGNYQVKASYGSKTSKTKYTKKDIDILIAYIPPTDTYYIIPIKEIQSCAIDVFPSNPDSKGKYEKFKENWAILKT